MQFWNHLVNSVLDNPSPLFQSDKTIWDDDKWKPYNNLVKMTTTLSYTSCRQESLKEKSTTIIKICLGKIVRGISHHVKETHFSHKIDSLVPCRRLRAIFLLIIIRRGEKDKPVDYPALYHHHAHLCTYTAFLSWRKMISTKQSSITTYLKKATNSTQLYPAPTSFHSTTYFRLLHCFALMNFEKVAFSHLKLRSSLKLPVKSSVKENPYSSLC